MLKNSLNDLILISFRAQCDYVLNNMPDYNRRFEFCLGGNKVLKLAELYNDNLNLMLNSFIGTSSDYKLPMQIYIETYKKLTQRFTEGKSRDAYFERIL